MVFLIRVRRLSESIRFQSRGKCAAKKRFIFVNTLVPLISCAFIVTDSSF